MVRKLNRKESFMAKLEQAKEARQQRANELEEIDKEQEKAVLKVRVAQLHEKQKRQIEIVHELIGKLKDTEKERDKLQNELEKEKLENMKITKAFGKEKRRAVNRARYEGVISGILVMAAIYVGMALMK